MYFLYSLYSTKICSVDKKKKKRRFVHLGQGATEPHTTVFIALATVIQHMLTGFHNFRGSRISVLIFDISLSPTKHIISCLDFLFFRAVQIVMFYRRWGSPLLRATAQAKAQHPSHPCAHPCLVCDSVWLCAFMCTLCA